MSGAGRKAAAEFSKFSWEGFKKTWEVTPLLAVVVLDMMWVIGVSAWMFNTRDIQVNKRRLPINERVDLLNPWPLKMIGDRPEPLPQLHEIYQNMDEEQMRRTKELEDLRKQAKKKSRKN